MDDSIGILRQMLDRTAKLAELAEAAGDNMAAHHRNACRALNAGIDALQADAREKGGGGWLAGALPSWGAR